MIVAKPVIGYFLDSGAQVLLSEGYAELADIGSQQDLSIQDWCVHYQTC